MLDEMKKEIESDYERFREFDGYNLSPEDYNEYDRTGNRLNFESKYFAKRQCLTARAMHTYLNESKPDADLIRIIESICDEYSWVLPGHKAENPYVDLYSAMTGHMLCEIAHYIELPDELHKKIHDNVKIRIKDMYENNVSNWESYENNWLPVCAGRIGMIYLYEFAEDFPKVRQRILDSMQKYVDGFGDDGVCVEGIGYWGFGFGNYLYFAQMLKSFEGTDILQNEKIKAIAKFQQYMFLKNNITASFSDSSKHEVLFGIGRTHFLRKEFGPDIKVPPDRYRMKIERCYDWACVFRSFEWFDASITADEEYFTKATEEKYFADAKWYINRKNKFSFAAKAGHNEEFHNHNDIGSFIITDGECQLITDFGATEYTKDYFTADKRYEIFCCSSGGHSVPIIDGKYQSSGVQHKSEVIKASGNSFCIEMSQAYDIAELTALRREFEIKENSVVLCDKFCFSDNAHDVTERFISVIKPENSHEGVKIGSMLIRTDSPAVISEQVVNSHFGEKKILYIIDFAPEGCEFSSEFIFNV